MKITIEHGDGVVRVIDDAHCDSHQKAKLAELVSSITGNFGSVTKAVVAKVTKPEAK